MFNIFFETIVDVFYSAGDKNDRIIARSIIEYISRTKLIVN